MFVGYVYLSVTHQAEYRGKLGYKGQIFNRIGGVGGFHSSRAEKNLIGPNDVIESSQRGIDPPFHKTAV